MCMFCHKTLERLQKGLPEMPIQLIDVTSDPIVINGLVAVTNKNAVPVIVDIGHATPETTPIISGYSEESLDKLIQVYRSQLSAAAANNVPTSEPTSGGTEVPTDVPQAN
jgi:trehalose-6-phosphatase